MEKHTIFEAERKLFCDTVNGVIKQKIEREIKAIIAACAAVNEIGEIMKIFSISVADFELMYSQLYFNSQYSDMIYWGDPECLFATAIFFDTRTVHALGRRIKYRSETENIARDELLKEEIIFVANVFFYRSALQRKISDVSYYHNVKGFQIPKSI